MATRVDVKLLKQTKFPPEFNHKVDMTKVNIEVMKKWIAGKLSELLGSEDDVVIELCFNLLEGSRFPDIKSLQIQLTGFLDKDTARFCKELWNLCLSAQANPQGVPKELLEAKKLELRQEKLDAEKAAQEARRRKEQERARERELESVRQRERAERTRGWRGGARGGRDFDRRDFRASGSPPRRRSRDRHRDAPQSRHIDSYVPPGARPSRWAEGRGRRPDRSISRSRSRSRSLSRTPPRRSRHVGRWRSKEKRRPRTVSRSPSRDRRAYRRDNRHSPDYGDNRARSGTRSYSSRSPSPRRHRKRFPSASSRSGSRSPPPKVVRRRRDHSPSRSRSGSMPRLRSHSRSSSREPGGKANGRRRPSSPDSRVDRRELRADVGKGRKSRDNRRLSRSREQSRDRRRRSPDRSRSPGSYRPGRPHTRSLSPRRDRSRSPSHGRRKDKKRRRSIERYAPVARRRRNTSSVSVPTEKRQRMADTTEDNVVQTSPRTDRRGFRDKKAHDKTQAKPTQPTAAVRRSSTTELRERAHR